MSRAACRTAGAIALGVDFALGVHHEPADVTQLDVIIGLVPAHERVGGAIGRLHAAEETYDDLFVQIVRHNILRYPP